MLYSYTIASNKLSSKDFKYVDKATNHPHLEWRESTVSDQNNTSSELDTNIRKSKNTWIFDKKIIHMLAPMVHGYNHHCLNVEILGHEPVQCSEYYNGGYYDWHVDQLTTPIFLNPEDKIPTVRKISLSLFLNDPDEYEGGELDVEIGGPKQDPRYATYKLEKGSVVIFQSNVWHRVRPVTSGKRRSIVVWFYGAPYT